LSFIPLWQYVGGYFNFLVFVKSWFLIYNM
jgi:hypothetical protein